jgi:hypothetical protein
MFPSPPLTDPDVRDYRIRFFKGYRRMRAAPGQRLALRTVATGVAG